MVCQRRSGPWGAHFIPGGRIVKSVREVLRRRRTKVLGVMVIASLLTAAAFSVGASAARKPARQEIKKWQQAMERLRVPGKGCFAASYPKVQWQRRRCKVAPHHPYGPAHGHRPQTVGNGNDYAAEVSGSISSAVGSFDSISAGATETGIRNGSGPQVANTFALQLNTKPFTSSVCTGHSGCKGWEQFIYSSTADQVFIQFWLLGYGATCPSGYSAQPGNNCYTNSSSSTLSGTAPTAASLGSVTLTGSAAAGGNDTVVMTTGSGNATASNVDSKLGLANNWKGVEFAVVGDCCSTQANFSTGTKLVVRTVTHSGTRMAPACVVEGFTGETNNLNLVKTPGIGTPASPTIISDQNQGPGTAASCAAADGLGDTHLTTFRNLLYDFQASGDFVLATTGPKFIAQTRQVSGAPAWPNASVNKAVAARVDGSDVAVCLAPTRVVINGKTVPLASGTQRDLPNGADVSRFGNVYLIRSGRGDSLRAEVNPGNPSWINASVGLGRSPAGVHGLLANAGNQVDAIQSRGGAVLTGPFAFNQLYHLYGDSWRVPAKQSLLSPCGGKAASGDPQRLLYASDLPPKLARAARAVCSGTGVEAAPLLDACTVDVAVLRNKAAAKVYRSISAQVTWGKIILPPFGSPAGPP